MGASAEKVLVLAPHADDETIGMGATISQLSRNGTRVVVVLITVAQPKLSRYGHLNPARTKEFSLAVEALGAEPELGLSILDEIGRISLRAYDELKLPSSPELAEQILRTIKRHSPDYLYIPHWHEMHQDHRAVSAAAKVASRPFLPHRLKGVYAYFCDSVWSFGTDLVRPNLIYRVSTEDLENKRKAMAIYRREIDPETLHPRNPIALEAATTLNGYRVGTSSAELFETLWEVRGCA